MTHSLRKDILIERLAAFLAFGALLVVILLPCKPRLWVESLGDFKLVYASTATFLHSGDAYNLDGLGLVFQQNHVVPPASWYGHAPVYPPFTLVLLMPMLLLPMIPAAYVWASLSYLAVALASLRLTRYADAQFGLPLIFRLLIIALMAGSPLINFGLNLANLSVIASCLCIFAVTGPPQQSSRWKATALLGALLLKPHLAIWVVLALLVMPAKREAAPSSRALATQALFFFGALLTLLAAGLAFRHQLVPLLTSYGNMLHLEAAGGSMDPRNHFAIIIPAQITSLASLLGYWTASLRLIATLQVLTLAPLALALLYASFRASLEWRLLVVSGWVAFGFLVTYHRAHDGAILFLLLPWILARLRQRWWDGQAWSVTLLYGLFSIDIPPEFYQRLSAFAPLHALANLLLFRQVALASALLFLSLAILLLRANNLKPEPQNLGEQD